MADETTGVGTRAVSHGTGGASQIPASSARIAEVVFNLPLERSFHYLIPPEFVGAVRPGLRVMAPFGPRERVGWVVDVLAESPIRELKTIRRVLDSRPVIADDRWPLASWLSRYYSCSVGEALSVMVPSGLRVPRSIQPMADSTGGHEESKSGPPSPSLTGHQRRALNTILAALESARYHTILLQGVTASGKTELYLQAIAWIIQHDRSAICLVPEIALTPQTIERFRGRFGERVVIWHSRLPARERSSAWDRMARGEVRIVVGTRSAIFAPVPQLGLLILDEEQEEAYKQEETPRYHARNVAVARARLVGATVLLGSATPSVESYYAATRGRSRLVRLPERVTRYALPTVELIDMRESLRHRHRAGALSDRLQRAIAEVVDSHGQAMLLLNRRGFARVAQCKVCGVVERCVRCAVPLVYHAGAGELICHYCNFHRTLEETCRQCRKGSLRLQGAGTERIESELHRLFPTSAIARMDRDTTRARESHQQIYEAVKAESVSLLVGTQMIAKGLDFPEVTLVGIVSADTALNLPDFRAGERTFDLLTQMAGRAGRGERPGRVLIQTFCPTHYAIQAAQHHDYQRFYDTEIQMRRRLMLPPFVHLIELLMLGGSQARVEQSARVLAMRLRRAMRGKRIALVGPAPHRVPRLRRTYRMCLLLKGRKVEPMVAILRSVLEPGRKFQGLPVLVNVDPL